MSEDRTRDLPDNRSFEERVFARFDAMEARFVAFDARFAAMEARFVAMEARFDAIDTRFDAMEARFDSVDARLAALDTRVQVLEAKAYDTKPIWERALAEILELRQGVEEVKGRVENIERKFDVLALDMMQLRGDQRRAEKRTDALESRLQ
jgi:chromosome segregation ATPase